MMIPTTATHLAAVTGQPIHRIAGDRYYAINGSEIVLTLAQARAIAPLLTDGVPENIDADAVRFEAGRRIGIISTDYEQRNATARSVELTVTLAEGGTLTAEEQAERTDIETMWAEIKAIRAASNILEAAESLPGDYLALVDAFDAALA